MAEDDRSSVDRVFRGGKWPQQTSHQVEKVRLLNWSDGVYEQQDGYESEYIYTNCIGIIITDKHLQFYGLETLKSIISKFWNCALIFIYTGCPNKHGNSVTNSISSLLRITIVIPNFKSHNITMSARVYFMRVNGCKDASIMFPQNEQWRRTSFLCL